MNRNHISKGLELLLIPLFALMSTSCDTNVKSDIISTYRGHRYFVTANKAHRIEATMESPGIDNYPIVYRLIDRQGDGKVDSVSEGTEYFIAWPITITRAANMNDQDEYVGVYSNHNTQSLLKQVSE